MLTFLLQTSIYDSKKYICVVTSRIEGNSSGHVFMTYLHYDNVEHMGQ